MIRSYSSGCLPLVVLMAIAYANVPIKAAFHHQQQHHHRPFAAQSIILKTSAAAHCHHYHPSTAFVLQYRNTMITKTSLQASKGKFDKTEKKSNSDNEDDKEDDDDDTNNKQSATIKEPLRTYSARFIEDNGIRLSTDDDGYITAELGTIVRDPKLQRAGSKQDDLERVQQVKEKKNKKAAAAAAAVVTSEDVSFLDDVDRTTDVIVNFNSKEMGSSSVVEAATENDLIQLDKKEQVSTTDDKIGSTFVDVENSQENVVAVAAVDDAEKTATTKDPITIPIKRPNLKTQKESLQEQPAKVVPKSGFNVVLTHCTADFDSLASAVGLSKLWSSTSANDADDGGVLVRGGTVGEEEEEKSNKDFDSASDVPTFVVLPRGAHPGVQRFLALHKHLFPIRSLKSLPDDLSGLNRLGLVDAQRRDRIGPAESLLQHANRVTVVDHHIDSDTDIPEATDYVVDQVGSVSTIIAERLQQANLDLTEAEATLLALGIHADTGSLCYDSTTPRDALALAWTMSQGASQAAIAEHAQSSLSPEQQGVLTQALINANSTVVHGVTVSTVLLSADGFINGLAAVTQDALDLSSSDIFLLSMVYEAQSGGRGKKRSKNKAKKGQGPGQLTSRLLTRIDNNPNMVQNDTEEETAQTQTSFADAWRGGEEAMRRRRLQAAFDRADLDLSGYLEEQELAATMAASGIVASAESIKELMDAIDSDGDGRINFEEFCDFAIHAEKKLQEEGNQKNNPRTMIVIGRVKAGVNLKGVKLNRLLERFGGGGHAKAASATIRLNDESEAEPVLQGLVDELISTSLQEQVTVGDFMTAPVLSVKPHMTEKQVEDLFTRYDVRALPVVDDENEVIGLVTYKEVAAAKQRLWNKEQKRLRREKELAEKGETIPPEQVLAMERQRKAGSTVKGWMKQHVRLVDDCTTMAELEAILLESDVGCIPVVASGTNKLIGMVTRTDLLRQHRYYPSLHYHNRAFSDSIAARKPIIELRKRLKKFDPDD